MSVGENGDEEQKSSLSPNLLIVEALVVPHEAQISSSQQVSDKHPLVALTLQFPPTFVLEHPFISDLSSSMFGSLQLSKSPSAKSEQKDLTPLMETEDLEDHMNPVSESMQGVLLAVLHSGNSRTMQFEPSHSNPSLQSQL